MLDIQNGKYFVISDEVLYIIKSSAIVQIDESNPEEMNLIYAGGQNKEIDFSKYKRIVRIPKQQNNLIKLKLSLGLNAFGKNKTTYESTFFDTTFTKDVETGYSVALEVICIPVKRLGVGVGVNYQFPRKMKKSDESEFQFFPIYAIGSYNVYSFKPFDFQLEARFGYNFFANKPKYLFKENGGKLFWNAGIETTFAERYFFNFSFQMDYQQKIDNELDQEFKNQYQSFGINFGIVVF